MLLGIIPPYIRGKENTVSLPPPPNPLRFVYHFSSDTGPDCTSSLYVETVCLFPLRVPCLFSVGVSQHAYRSKNSLEDTCIGSCSLTGVAETKSAYKAGPGGERAERGPSRTHVRFPAAGLSQVPVHTCPVGEERTEEEGTCRRHHLSCCWLWGNAWGLSGSCQSLSVTKETFPVLWGSTLFLPGLLPFSCSPCITLGRVMIRWLNIVRIKLAIIACMLSNSVVSSSLQPRTVAHQVPFAMGMFSGKNIGIAAISFSITIASIIRKYFPKPS